MKIELKNVSKKIKNNTIINDVSLLFESGKIYGIVGRNGSGKSVLLKIICGLYKPSQGDVFFDNINITKENIIAPSTRALINKPAFIDDLTGYDNLKILAQINNNIGDREIFDTAKEIDLSDELYKKYHTYSLGNRQKLGIAQVIMENPKVMIFDEPFNGIDDESTSKIRSYIKTKKDKNRIIIIATHIKEDIDSLCDEVIKIDVGKIVKR